MITQRLMELCFPTKGINPTKYNLVRFRADLVSQLNSLLPKYNIDNADRVRAFLSVCGIETDYFRTSEEYASGKDYEGRRDLGNVEKGDGRRFKGSGLIQVTGRANFYRVMVRFVKKLTGKDYTGQPAKAATEANKYGVNFIINPEYLRHNIKYAVESACMYWDDNNLNAYADAKKIKELNGLVNRGSASKMPLHWAKRRDLYDKLCRLIPSDFTFAEEENADAAVTTPPEAPIPTIDLDKAQSSFSTLQNPSLTTLMKRAGGRLVLGLGAVWGTTGGKIAVVLTLAVLITVVVGVIYAYRKQIMLGLQIAKATIKKMFGGFVS